MSNLEQELEEKVQAILWARDAIIDPLPLREGNKRILETKNFKITIEYLEHGG